MTKSATQKVGGAVPQPKVTDPPIQKKKKGQFNKMFEKLKKRAFSARVDSSDKSSITTYLNEELKRHIDGF